MRKPSEYIPAAMAKLRRSLIPDCSEVLRHGGRSATVTRIGSPSIGEDPLNGVDVPDDVRVLALFADFPALSKGDIARLGDAWRIAVAVRTDPSRTTLTIGFSAPLSTFPAVYSGTRREGGRVRAIELPADILAIQNPDEPTIYGDAAAPSYAQSWTCCIPAAAWTELSPPQVGDELRFTDERGGCYEELRLRVSSAVRNSEWWTLRARPRGGA